MSAFKGLDIKDFSDVLIGLELAAGDAGRSIQKLWKSFTSSPVAMAVAATAAIVAAYDLVTESAAEANERMEDAFSNYDSAKNNVSSIKSEIEDTKSKIDELNSKGGLTLTEKSELRQLEKQNAELQKTLDIAEMEETFRAKLAAASVYFSYNSIFHQDILGSAQSIQQIKPHGIPFFPSQSGM